MGAGRDFPALGFDPAPGDAQAVQHAADQFNSSGNTVSSAHDTVTGVHLNSAWTGQAADGAQKQIDAMGQSLGSTHGTMTNAGKVLGQWSSDLSGFQSKASQLETEAEQAQQKLQTAESSSDLKLAGQTFSNQADAQAAQQRYQTAVSDKQTAQQGLDNIKQQAKQLQQQHQQAASSVAKALKTGTGPSDDSPQNEMAKQQTGTSSAPGTLTPGQPIDQSQISYGGKDTYPGGSADAVSGEIDKALDAKGITDPTARQNWKNGLTTISSRESSYNAPGQQVGEVSGDVNNNGPILSDGAHANASRGGWQVTPSNFAQFHQPGTSDDIYDPTANAASAINYIQSRYHVSDDGSNLTANVQQADPSRDPHWY